MGQIVSQIDQTDSSGKYFRHHEKTQTFYAYDSQGNQKESGTTLFYKSHSKHSFFTRMKQGDSRAWVAESPHLLAMVIDPTPWTYAIATSFIALDGALADFQASNPQTFSIATTAVKTVCSYIGGYAYIVYAAVVAGESTTLYANGMSSSDALKHAGEGFVQLAMSYACSEIGESSSMTEGQQAAAQFAVTAVGTAAIGMLRGDNFSDAFRNGIITAAINWAIKWAAKNINKAMNGDQSQNPGNINDMDASKAVDAASEKSASSAEFRNNLFEGMKAAAGQVLAHEVAKHIDDPQAAAVVTGILSMMIQGLQRDYSISDSDGKMTQEALKGAIETYFAGRVDENGNLSKDENYMKDLLTGIAGNIDFGTYYNNQKENEAKEMLLSGNANAEYKERLSNGGKIELIKDEDGNKRVEMTYGNGARKIITADTKNKVVETNVYLNSGRHSQTIREDDNGKTVVNYNQDGSTTATRYGSDGNKEKEVSINGGKATEIIFDADGNVSKSKEISISKESLIESLFKIMEGKTGSNGNLQNNTSESSSVKTWKNTSGQTVIEKNSDGELTYNQKALPADAKNVKLTTDKDGNPVLTYTEGDDQTIKNDDGEFVTEKKAKTFVTMLDANGKLNTFEAVPGATDLSIGLDGMVRGKDAAGKEFCYSKDASLIINRKTVLVPVLDMKGTPIAGKFETKEVGDYAFYGAVIETDKGAIYRNSTGETVAVQKNEVLDAKGNVIEPAINRYYENGKQLYVEIAGAASTGDYSFGSFGSLLFPKQNTYQILELNGGMTRAFDTNGREIEISEYGKNKADSKEIYQTLDKAENFDSNVLVDKVIVDDNNLTRVQGKEYCMVLLPDGTQQPSLRNVVYFHNDVEGVKAGTKLYLDEDSRIYTKQSIMNDKISTIKGEGYVVANGNALKLLDGTNIYTGKDGNPVMVYSKDLVYKNKDNQEVKIPLNIYYDLNTGETRKLVGYDVELGKNGEFVAFTDKTMMSYYDSTKKSKIETTQSIDINKLDAELQARLKPVEKKGENGNKYQTYELMGISQTTDVYDQLVNALPDEGKTETYKIIFKDKKTGAINGVITETTKENVENSTVMKIGNVDVLFKDVNPSEIANQPGEVWGNKNIVDKAEVDTGDGIIAEVYRTTKLTSEAYSIYEGYLQTTPGANPRYAENSECKTYYDENLNILKREFINEGVILNYGLENGMTSVTEIYKDSTGKLETEYTTKYLDKNGKTYTLAEVEHYLNNYTITGNVNPKDAEGRYGAISKREVFDLQGNKVDIDALMANKENNLNDLMDMANESINNNVLPSSKVQAVNSLIHEEKVLISATYNDGLTGLKENVNQYTGVLDVVMRAAGFVLGEQMPEILRSSETESGKLASQTVGAVAIFVPGGQAVSLMIAGRDLSGSIVKTAYNNLDYLNNIEEGKFNLSAMDKEESRLTKKWVVDVGMSAASFGLEFNPIAKAVQSLDVSLNTQQFLGLTGVYKEGIDVGAKVLESRIKNVVLDIPKIGLEYQNMLDQVESGQTNGLWSAGTLVLKTGGMLLGMAKDYEMFSRIENNDPVFLTVDEAKVYYNKSINASDPNYNVQFPFITNAKAYENVIDSTVKKAWDYTGTAYKITKDGYALYTATNTVAGKYDSQNNSIIPVQSKSYSIGSDKVNYYLEQNKMQTDYSYTQVNGLWQLTNKNNPNDYYVILNDGYVYNNTTDTIVDNLGNYESKGN